MEYIACDLSLCTEPATRVRLCSPAREFLDYLCECHWERLHAQRPDLAACYEPITPLSAHTSSGSLFLIANELASHSPWIQSKRTPARTAFRAIAS